MADAANKGITPDVVAELRQGDSAERKGRRVVSQGDALQCAEGIARREYLRRSSDQRVHLNPDTLVTPTVSMAGATFFS